MSIEVWLRCQERLLEGAKQGGLRRKPRHPDPNKYPIRVICKRCGEYMCGSPYGGEPCYVCSSYSNSHGEECLHAWVQRDLIVGFAVRAIQETVSEARHREALREVLRDLLREKPKASAAEGDVEEL